LAQRKYAFIAKQLGMSHKQVEEAHAFIKTRLTPFPASSAVDHAAHVEASPPQVVTPQVVIRRQRVRDGSPYSVEIVEAEQFQVRMNPAYSEAYRELRSQHTICHESERTHLRHYMNHAHLVISSLQRRWQTLRRITCCLVKRQERFLERGNVALLPLTRAEVAEELGLHPSTISRAVADKYVLLPVGATISFDTFFLANLSVKAALKELLDHESSPRSDQRLAELLAAQGIQIARRTVAKYREELRIPDSSRR
jgi:RNA polymerase sigma-54 factor